MMELLQVLAGTPGMPKSDGLEHPGGTSAIGEQLAVHPNGELEPTHERIA
jgi:hypothetical protein